MDVVIVSKTRMHSGVCVGGVLTNGKLVRLLKSDGHNQDSDTDFEIGDVYTIKFKEREDCVPPHMEDILLLSQVYKSKFRSIQEMIQHLKVNLKINIWEGSVNCLFNNSLQWKSSGSGYISRLGKIPNQSTGFWIPDKDLVRKDYGDKVRYRYSLNLFPPDYRVIPYVGLQESIYKIPKGTLVRLSLARWWTPNDDEERCYLQLSGWYL